MKISIHNKIFLFITIPYIILTLTLLYIIKSYSRKDTTETIYYEMKSKAHLINEIYNNYGIEKLRETIENLKKQNNLPYRVTVISEDGKVIFDSEKDSKEMENHKSRPEFIKALSGETGSSIRFSNTLGTDMAYLAIPITEGDKITGATRISLSMSEFSARANRLNTPILMYGILVILLFYIIAFFIISRLLTPIDELISVCVKFKEGDLSARLLMPPGKEYEVLYTTINDMLSKIQSLIDENQKRYNELISIISSIQEVIIIIDKNNTIRLYNNSLTQLAGKNENDLIGRKIYEILKISELNELIRKTFSTKRNLSDEIEFNGSSYYVSTSYNASNDTVIILLYNNTHIKKMESYKKDLISNVSHELKTPLTAINGFVETLLDETDNENHRRYLNIIKNHTSRLNNIVNDLLTLTSLENGLSLNISEHNINEIIQEVIPLFKKTLSEKGLNLILDLTELPLIQCDRFRIEQALINLIDNAVKYTDNGSITISTKQDNNYAIISVQDTGIGISESELPRIFERFYVVNKSRTRSTGGTGLGLSIVKHIVQRHNGSIEIQSKPLEGTIFTILLPAKLTIS